MKDTLLYYKARKAGYSAKEAWRIQTIVARFSEFDGEQARIAAFPEEGSYFDFYGKPEGYTGLHGRRVSAEQEKKELIELLDQNGCWTVCAQILNESGDWETVDSVGMCAGYAKPTDPICNAYVVDLMVSAMDKLTQPEYSI